MGLITFPRDVLGRDLSLPASASARGAIDFMPLMEKNRKKTEEVVVMSSTAVKGMSKKRCVASRALELTLESVHYTPPGDMVSLESHPSTR